MSTKTHQSTDPQVYDIHHQKFLSDGLPTDQAGWLERARRVADIFATDVAVREKENKSPVAEVSLLKSSGLLKLLGPKEFGGGGEDWALGYKAIREVAKGDGSLGMLLGYHLYWSTAANVLGTDEQRVRWQKEIIENNYFVGGAVNPRDNDLTVTSDGDEIVFNGLKNFNTGGVVSDLTVLEGAYTAIGAHIFAIVKTNQPGVQFAHNWDNIGVRLTESGSVKLVDVRAAWTDALGWDAETRQPLPHILSTPFATLPLPTIQLVFSNFYLGIALGALDTAARYTTTTTRSWPFTNDPKAAATDEFYILERYGAFSAHLRAAEALTDRAGDQLRDLYARYSGSRELLTARQRGDVAETIAAVKVVTTDVGLEVTAGVFEVTGARATASKVGLDRFWRDLRTHTLHDPVAYKRRELGRYKLLDEIPEPTWYT
ncbi:MAG: hypothetical protein M1819_000234 [Sarea resinae]|nr:MAG: hypothetical protein M1819_000234 [Sarea resinae]